MRLFGYDITVRKHRPLVPYTPPPPDTLTMREVEVLRKGIKPAAPLPNGCAAICYPIRRGELKVSFMGENTPIDGGGPHFAHATVRPVRLLDTLGWAWAIDNPVEGVCQP